MLKLWHKSKPNTINTWCKNGKYLDYKLCVTKVAMRSAWALEMVSLHGVMICNGSQCSLSFLPWGNCNPKRKHWNCDSPTSCQHLKATNRQILRIFATLVLTCATSTAGRFDVTLDFLTNNSLCFPARNLSDANDLIFTACFY